MESRVTQQKRKERDKHHEKDHSHLRVTGGIAAIVQGASSHHTPHASMRPWRRPRSHTNAVHLHST